MNDVQKTMQTREFVDQEREDRNKRRIKVNEPYKNMKML